jgi:hypothetical protein
MEREIGSRLNILHSLVVDGRNSFVPSRVETDTGVRLGLVL